jgi:diguanylate cyclase (GGDEF)-like protein
MRDQGGVILLVDDEIATIEVMAEVLDPMHEVIFATSGPEALRLAAETQPDLILLDVVMPGMSGYQVCARLKADPVTTAIPVIFVTARGSSEDETQGLEIGAIDYVTKPISPAIVRARVRNHLALKRAHDLLAKLSATDGLTGLANRRQLEQVLEQEYLRHSRTNRPLSLIMIDVDHFKDFNDAFGHMAGDDCLRRVAGVVAGIRRSPDLAARYGGEEFTCVLPETDHAEAIRVAERIRHGIASLGIHHPQAPHGVVTASLGVATSLCQADGNGAAAQSLLDHADRRLYLAKAGGRNRVIGQAG